jgi:CheY-like chemotaxis protein
LDAAHEELIAWVSHELRAPLHAMLGWAQMLLTHERVANDEQLSRGLATIVRNAKLQARVIDDLIDASSLLSGQTRLQIAPLSAETAVHAATESIAHAALAKDVQLRVAIEDESAYVLADSERMQQILSNLLLNALKFSPHGGAIDVRVRREDACVCVEVEDDGPGVEEELAPFVFDRFRQGTAGHAVKGGLGLGLSIARGLVELHRGTISVGRGSRGAVFCVRLPSAAPSGFDSQLPPPPHAGFSTLLAGTRIAIVDGEADASDLLRVVLERSGARVDGYASADRLFASGRPFDALISDIRMANGGGSELPAVLRERGISAPAIALTGHASPRDRLRALQAGFQMHVSKPVDGHELVVTIASVLGRFLPKAP